MTEQREMEVTSESFLCRDLLRLPVCCEVVAVISHKALSSLVRPSVSPWVLSLFGSRLRNSMIVVINLECQVDGLYNHHGNKPLGRCRGSF